MNRREFLSLVSGAAVAIPTISPMPLIVTVNHVIDVRAKLGPTLTHNFWSRIWPEAVRDLESCGVRLQGAPSSGEVRRSPSGQPLIDGLQRHVINFVITDRIPIKWDGGRGLSGVTTRYYGYHLCMVALYHAHCHQIPFLSVNTCVHELLHVLLQDVFEGRPEGLLGEAREFRIDWHATRLWLFHDGRTIRKAAQAYVERLRYDS